MHIYSDVRVPCVHSVYEELRSGCAVNLYGSFRRNKDAKSFMVELLSRSAAVMVLEFDLTHSEIRAFSASTAGVDRLKAFNFDFKQIRRFHLHISVSDSYFDIEMNGTFIGCFIPVGDIRTVTNVGIKGDVNANLLTVEGFPYLKSWYTFLKFDY
ncbi:hypothetical protein Q1695_001448 [Nippostrongylus brasiliensis]|nr:hypothetical protein Q1695_001448 [Nippostrongylus brasiliensis]